MNSRFFALIPIFLCKMPQTTDVKITGFSVINHGTKLNKGIQSLIRLVLRDERPGVCYELFTLNLQL